MVILTVLVGLVFFLAGKRSPESLLAALIGCSLGVVLIVPMGISRDKMEGTLDFLCGLPVESRDIAASRLIAVALLAVPWAVGVGAFSVVVPTSIELGPVRAAMIAWLTMLVLGAIATALFVCFDLESLLGAPIVAMIVMLVVVPRVVHVFIPQITQESVLRFLAGGAASTVVVTVFFSAVLATVLASHQVSARALARYRAGPSSR